MGKVRISSYLLLIVLVLCVSIFCAKSYYAKDIAIKYERNIVDAIVDESAEVSVISDKFITDGPRGIYENQKISDDLMDKYDMYLYILDNASYLDAKYSFDDVEAAQLTIEELLTLSDVSFNYYYDYRNNELIQYFIIDWINQTKTTGYVVWKYDYVVEYRRF